ncbi:HSP20-like chaperone [Neocallimastix lanati (nom. inval.)]|nr:HSP20-like chaperone [Neocallimastix sp. JGI-2020a]
MSLYLFTKPIRNSLFDDFENNFFNYPITKKHHFGICNPRHIHKRHGHCKNSLTTLEKQLSRALRNNELFNIVEFSPKINISEDENNYYIHADLPGMNKDQVKIELNEEHILTISGERKSIYNSNDDDNDNHHSESIESEMETKEKTGNKDKNEKKEKDNEIETESEGKKEYYKNLESKETSKFEENNKMQYNIKECNYGKFSRSLTIPEDVDIENIQAKMANGVLEVVFKKIKPQEHQNRTIQIQ